MGCISEFYCMVKDETNDVIVVHGEPRVWTTYRWNDEFGNSIAPFFTSLGMGQPFLDELPGWRLRRYPVSFVVSVILADIKQDTSFYTINPVTKRKFKALSPVQFLAELIYHRQPVGTEAMPVVPDHDDIIPIKTLLGKGHDPDAEAECLGLLSAADVIFGIDVITGKQSIVFGRSSLAELVRTGQCNVLGVVNVGLGEETRGLEKLARLVQDIKGHHDYCASGVA